MAGQVELLDEDVEQAKKEAEEAKLQKSAAPISGHLKELRNRLIKCVIVVVILMIASFYFGNDVIELLKYPLKKAASFGTDPELVKVIELQSITAMENLSVFFKVCLVSSLIVAMPYLVYHILAFVTPGLTGKEKRLLFTALPFIVFMFLAGVAFAYFIALPPALNFLYNFNTEVAEVHGRISDYIDLVSRMLLVVGIVFETPIIVMVLAKFGIVSPDWLAKRRKIWIVMAFVLSAIITPTFDPVNQTIIAVPLILLLELGIFLSRIVYKDKRNTVPAAEDKDTLDSADPDLPAAE